MWFETKSVELRDMDSCPCLVESLCSLQTNCLFSQKASLRNLTDLYSVVNRFSLYVFNLLLQLWRRHLLSRHRRQQLRRHGFANDRAMQVLIPSEVWKQNAYFLFVFDGVGVWKSGEHKLFDPASKLIQCRWRVNRGIEWIETFPQQFDGFLADGIFWVVGRSSHFSNVITWTDRYWLARCVWNSGWLVDKTRFYRIEYCKSKLFILKNGEWILSPCIFQSQHISHINGYFKILCGGRIHRYCWMRSNISCDRNNRINQTAEEVLIYLLIYLSMPSAATHLSTNLSACN